MLFLRCKNTLSPTFPLAPPSSLPNPSTPNTCPLPPLLSPIHSSHSSHSFHAFTTLTPRTTPTISILIFLGQWQDALPVVQESIDIDPHYQYAYGYRGLLKHTLGWPRRALNDLQKAAEAKRDVDYIVAALTGVCHTCLGEL